MSSPPPPPSPSPPPPLPPSPPQAASTQVYEPHDVAVDTANNILYYVDRSTSYGYPGYAHSVVKVDLANNDIARVVGTGYPTGGPSGNDFFTYSLGDGGPATLATLKKPSAIAFDATMNL